MFLLVTSHNVFYKQIYLFLLISYELVAWKKKGAPAIALELNWCGKVQLTGVELCFFSGTSASTAAEQNSDAQARI